MCATWGKECVHAKSLQSCLTLCNPIDYSPRDSSVHEILQAKILEWVAMPSFRGSSWPRYWTHVSCIGRQSLYHWAIRKAQCESSELSFIWVKMRMTAWETAPQIALRDCSKQAAGEGRCIRFWWRKSSVQSSTYFTKGFLLIMRSWCCHEGI